MGKLKDKISRKSFDIIYIKEKREKFWEKIVKLNKFQSLDVLNCISKGKQNENSHDLKRGCSEKLIFL